MSIDSVVVTNMAQAMKKRRVMLLPCLMIDDMMRPATACNSNNGGP